MNDEQALLIETYAAAKLPMLALNYAVDGGCSCRWPDCPAKAKHPIRPLLPHGVHDASADVDTVREWRRRYPLANIGVRPPKGVIVLDVDPRHGGDVELDRLQAQHGPLPRTLAARTGGGGWHYWFGYSGPCRGHIGPGLDIKTNAGYVLVEPSVHICGGKYEWTDKSRTARAPGWLIELLSPPVRHRRMRGSTGSGRGLVKAVAEAPEGNRNNILHWAACRAVEDGIDVFDDLIDAAVAGGQSEHEARATVHSAQRGVVA